MRTKNKNIVIDLGEGWMLTIDDETNHTVTDPKRKHRTHHGSLEQAFKRAMERKALMSLVEDDTVVHSIVQLLSALQAYKTELEDILRKPETHVKFASFKEECALARARDQKIKAKNTQLDTTIETDRIR